MPPVYFSDASNLVFIWFFGVIRAANLLAAFFIVGSAE